jgi:hypothetical protein
MFWREWAKNYDSGLEAAESIGLEKNFFGKSDESSPQLAVTAEPVSQVFQCL